MLLPLYLLVFAAVPFAVAFAAYEMVMFLSELDIKRSKKEQELFN